MRWYQKLKFNITLLKYAIKKTLISDRIVKENNKIMNK